MNNETKTKNMQAAVHMQPAEINKKRSNTASYSVLIHFLLVSFIGTVGAAIIGFVSGSSEMSPLSLALVTAIAPIVGTTAALIFTKMRGIPVTKRDIFGGEKLSAGVIIPMALMGIGAQGVNGVISMLIAQTGINLDITQKYIFSVLDVPVPAVIMFLYVVIVGPVMEELVFRGILLKALSFTGTTAAMIISSIFFGLMHGNIPQAVFAFFVGLILAKAAQKTGSLKTSIIIHIILNANSMITAIIGKALGETATPLLNVILITAYLVLGGIAFAVVMNKYIHTRKPKAERSAENATARTAVGRYFSTLPAIAVTVIYLIQVAFITLNSVITSLMTSAAA